MQRSLSDGEKAQRDVVAFLSSPTTHQLPDGAVEHVETHISHIVVAGPTAYKLKKAVALNFLDFSTVAARRRYCEREVALNQPFAPTIYRAARPILNRAGAYVLGDAADADDAAVVDWVVEMAAFDRTQELDRLADAGRLTPRHIDQLADVVADLHKRAPIADGCGGADAVRRTAREVRVSAAAAETAGALRDAFDR